METMVLAIFGGVIFVVFVTVLWLVAVRNGIVRGKNGVQRAWANVITYERYKLKVIPKLEEGLAKYGEYEKGLFEKITELRSVVAKLSVNEIDPAMLGEAQKLTQGLMTGLKATFENYPDLKAADLYKGWMNELTEAEANVSAAIQIFNANVEGFNNMLMVFPNNIVNNMFNKEKPINVFTDSAAAAGFEYKPNF